MVAELEDVHPVGRPVHAYVYVPDPPVGAEEKVTDSPTSAGLWLEFGMGTTSAGSTASVNVFDTVLPLVSVTVTCTVYGLLELEAGEQLKDATELPHPAGRPDHAYEV
jgi:hypothetical protein